MFYLDMRSAYPLRPLLLATLAAVALNAPHLHAAAPASTTPAPASTTPAPASTTPAPASTTPAPARVATAPVAPPSNGPTPRASADVTRMVATTFTNLVVFDNGAGYLHGFWRTLGTAGPGTPGRLQWGRGCPDISERVFLALHTAFANPDRFFLIVDKSPDPRQPGAHCLTHVELERINPPAEPPNQAPPAQAPAPAASKH